MLPRPPRARALLLRREEGQAALEFLLLVPTYILFLFITVDLGMLMYEYVSIANAAREGARFAATNCGDGFCTVSEVQNRVIERSGRILSASNASEIAVGWLDASSPLDGLRSGRGDSVVVWINHPYSFWFMPAGPSIPVMSCADMRLERRDKTAGLPPAASACST